MSLSTIFPFINYSNALKRKGFNCLDLAILRHPPPIHPFCQSYCIEWRKRNTPRRITIPTFLTLSSYHFHKGGYIADAILASLDDLSRTHNYSYPTKNTEPSISKLHSSNLYLQGFILWSRPPTPYAKQHLIEDTKISNTKPHPHFICPCMWLTIHQRWFLFPFFFTIFLFSKAPTPYITLFGSC